MLSRVTTLRKLLCLAALGASSLSAQTTPASGFYGGNTLELVVAPSGSFTGYFYDETVAGKFTCAFLIQSTSSPSRDGLYSITTWWPARELGEPVDDERVTGTLRVSAGSLTLQLPKDAHGGCWNVNGDLNNGEPVELTRDSARPAWQSLRVVKSKRIPLRQQPTPSAPARPYIVQGDVVIVNGRQGLWLHVDYYAFSSVKAYSGWVQESDLLPPL